MSEKVNINSEEYILRYNPSDINAQVPYVIANMLDKLLEAQKITNELLFTAIKIQIAESLGGYDLYKRDRENISKLLDKSNSL